MSDLLFQALKLMIFEVLGGFGAKSLGKDIPTGNMRLGVPLTAKRNSSTIQDLDEDELSKQHKQTAICLVINNVGKILSVTRGHKSNKIGLPGGGLELGEEPIDAAVRELWEETGLVAIDPNLVFVAEDSLGHVTSTFACRAIGEIKPSPEGDVIWADADQLIDDKYCPYSAYNKKLFHKLGLL